MKFSLEQITVKVNKEKQEQNTVESIIGPEIIAQNIETFCREVLVNEQEIGFGNFSYVYEDTRENGICYKKYKPDAEKRMNITAFSEMNFMENVYGLDDKVKTPYPLGLAEVVLKNNTTNKLSLVKLIAMEHFANTTKIEDVINPKSAKFKTEFPSSFDPDIFFKKLENFVKKMHEEKGIYHRDLFDRNILIDNETGNPIVIDFGDAAYNPIDDRYDAYGRPTYGGVALEDKDLKNIANMKRNVLQYIDNK